ncbi:MAG: hypothetical protein AAB476_01135, partial [Patescibacteria group bacterium]
VKVNLARRRRSSNNSFNSNSNRNFNLKFHQAVLSNLVLLVVALRQAQDLAISSNFLRRPPMAAGNSPLRRPAAVSSHHLLHPPCRLFYFLC